MPPPTIDQIVDASISGPRAAAAARPGTTIRVAPMPRDPRPEYTDDHTVSLERLRHAPPPNAMQKVQRAREAAKEGKIEKSIKLLKKAIKIHPNYIEAHNNLGVRYIKMGQPELAIEHLEKAAELAPSEALPHLNMAMALHAVGDLDAALLNAEQAVKLAPTLAEAQFNLAAILVELGQRLDEAVRSLRRVEDEYPMAALIRADALLQRGEDTKARYALRAFLADRYTISRQD